MARSIENAISRVDRQITKHKRILELAQQRIPKLTAQKEGLLKLKDKYPNGKFEGGAVHIETVDWNNIAGVSIDKQYPGGNLTVYTIKFCLNKNHSDGVKVYMIPPENKIAEAEYKRYYSTSSKSSDHKIKIFNYKGIIPESCPRRKVLIKHIKKQLLKMIRNRKYTISDDSFDKEDFLKLMLLT